MTSLHFIVYALCLSHLILFKIYLDIEKNRKKDDKKHDDMKIDVKIKLRYLEGMLDAIISGEGNISFKEAKNKLDALIIDQNQNVRRIIDNAIKYEIKEYWEKQFFTNNPDTKNG